jgi:hypothetical protein
MGMTLTATHTVRRPLPITADIAIGLLIVLGLGAVAGGWGMTFGAGGSSLLPDEYLDELPLVSNWVVPGLILLLGFGVGSLVTAYGVARQPSWRWLAGLERLTGYHWSWLATLVVGLGQMVWIFLELISISFSWLMPVFGLIGLGIFLLALTPSFRHNLRAT